MEATRSSNARIRTAAIGALSDQIQNLNDQRQILQNALSD